MLDPLNSRRAFMGAAQRMLRETAKKHLLATPNEDAQRLTSIILETKNMGMSRSRERVLTNLDDMYREAFDRAKASGDAAKMATLDFAYRREQLYFEILLDIRDAMERR